MQEEAKARIKINASCMQITSPVFKNGDMIPKKYGLDFENVNPPLAWSDVPDGTRSFALIMDDPDVPAAVGVPVWDHWLVWNIPAHLRAISEAWSVEGVRGSGTRGELEYTGPRPPDREHRYFFRLYAFDTFLSLPEGSNKAEVLEAMHGHVLAEAELMGRFVP